MSANGRGPVVSGWGTVRFTAMTSGSLMMVLHAHLPFVRHPEHQDHLEERWLFEAMAECYLPLVDSLLRLEADRVPFRLTVSLSPPLVAMLRDPMLCARFERHLAKIRRLLQRQGTDPAHRGVMRFLADRHAHIEALWQRIDRDLVGAFAGLEARGGVEIWTCAATHAFLPALVHHPEIQQAMVAVAIDAHTRAFGRRPKGIWLPECGYFPGVDRMLVAHGIAYTVVETHAVVDATPRPRAGTARPIVTSAGLTCFGRDAMASRQVWSRDEGYPGDPWYREFHRDAGFELPIEDVREFVVGHGDRQPTGVKFHRITGRGSVEKQVYEPAKAAERVVAHAADFVARRIEEARWLNDRAVPDPLMVAPYDAELFGHWWFEGVDFLEAVFRALPAARSELRAVTASDVLFDQPSLDLAEPEASSWGAGGYSGVWLDPSTSWMLRHVDHAMRVMIDTVVPGAKAGGVFARAGQQAARELLLLLSSDWPFLIKTGAAPDYARARFETHLARFRRLAAMIHSGGIDVPWLQGLEARDNLFPHLDLRCFQR